MNEDGSPAQEEPTEQQDEVVDYSTANDLDVELTEEQEQDFVEQILKEGNYTPPAEPETPVVPEPVTPVVPEPEAKVEPETPAPTEKPAENNDLELPQTDDLWVEVEKTVLNDDGDEVTETVKLVYDPADPGSFIPDDFTAKSTKQLAEIMEAKAEMASLYKERKGEYDSEIAEKDRIAQGQAQYEAWDTEIADLVTAGLIPDPATDKEDSEKLTDAVFIFMNDANKSRIESGRPVITSFGTAFTLYQNDEKVKADKEAEKQEIIDTKQKGGMVGGGSASSGGAPQKQAYIAGSSRNIWSVPVDGQ